MAVGGRGHTVGHSEPRRASKMQPQRAEFGEGGGGRVSGSLNREGQGTGTGTESELHLRSRMGPPWGSCRPSSVLPGKGCFLLASRGWGHREQDVSFHPPGIKVPICLSSQEGRGQAR